MTDAGAVMAQSTMIVAIDQPIERVFAFVADAETAPQWQTEIVEVRRTTAGPIGVGTAYRAVRARLREHVATALLITEYEPNRKVSFESTLDDVRFQDSYAFESVGNSTRITFRFELATRVRGARHMFSREAAALSTLKTVLEARGSAARAAQPTVALRPSSPAPATAR